LADLVIRNLHAKIADSDKEILRGIDLEVSRGETHAIMGPNGSGKSTLSHVLMGHPGYEVTEGEVLFNGEDLLSMEPDERSRAGLFLCFQYPYAVPGVTVANFLRTAINAHRGKDDPIRIPEFRTRMEAAMKLLDVDRKMSSRYLNDGFSGGEKKRLEILQLAMLKPSLAVLDETDSGLDIDALKVVARGVNAHIGPEMGAIVITHYQRILDYITPSHVHVLIDGRIARSGGAELAKELERAGYADIAASVEV
jgi:Fe-S cluster assembly ATP-binding protein